MNNDDSEARSYRQARIIGGLLQSTPTMPGNKVPQPGPAKLTKNSSPDEWLKCALNNQYLPETIMKKLCEICKELLMEGECTLVRSPIPSVFNQPSMMHD